MIYVYKSLNQYFFRLQIGALELPLNKIKFSWLQMQLFFFLHMRFPCANSTIYSLMPDKKRLNIKIVILVICSLASKLSTKPKLFRLGKSSVRDIFFFSIREWIMLSGFKPLAYEIIANILLISYKAYRKIPNFSHDIINTFFL